MSQQLAQKTGRLPYENDEEPICLLWSWPQEIYDVYETRRVKSYVKTVVDPVFIEKVIHAYCNWYQLEGDHWSRESRPKLICQMGKLLEDKLNKKLKQISSLHNVFLRQVGKSNKGIKKSSHKHRKSNCYNCQGHIDGSIHFDCMTCGWIVCESCGACGCGYRQALSFPTDSMKGQSFEYYEDVATDTYEDKIRAEYESEVNSELLGEFFSDADSAANSAENGWYYQED